MLPSASLSAPIDAADEPATETGGGWLPLFFERPNIEPTPFPLVTNIRRSEARSDFMRAGCETNRESLTPRESDRTLSLKWSGRGLPEFSEIASGFAPCLVEAPSSVVDLLNESLEEVTELREPKRRRTPKPGTGADLERRLSAESDPLGGDGPAVDLALLALTAPVLAALVLSGGGGGAEDRPPTAVIDARLRKGGAAAMEEEEEDWCCIARVFAWAMAACVTCNCASSSEIWLVDSSDRTAAFGCIAACNRPATCSCAANKRDASCTRVVGGEEAGRYAARETSLTSLSLRTANVDCSGSMFVGDGMEEV